MKTLAIFLISSLSYLLCQADIINGYQTELVNARLSLNNLTELMQKSTSKDEEKFYKLKSHYLRAKQTFKYLNTYYRLTEELIISLKSRHPVFYYELNSIRNQHQVITDVYVQVLPEDRMKHRQFGTTNLEQADNDPHQYRSSFGLNTVSIQIRDCSPAKKLKLLVHELGHVKYQVPNLASYMEYFQEAYREFGEKDSFGHLKEDPSNQSVNHELMAFHQVISRKNSPRKEELIASRKR